IQTAAHSFQTREGAGRAYTLIEKSRKETGSLPTDSEGTKLISSQMDAWDNAYRYKKVGEDSYLIISSGVDGEFDTQDDVQFEPGEFVAPPARPTTRQLTVPNSPPTNIPTH